MTNSLCFDAIKEPEVLSLVQHDKLCGCVLVCVCGGGGDCVSLEAGCAWSASEGST